MHHWLNQLKQLLAHGDAVVLVTVARVKGSAPRDAGTKMLVARQHTYATIGGGHLEWQAIELARRLLTEPPADASGQRRHLERIALGPSLGQCCGGVVTLAFERLTLADLVWVAALQKRHDAGLASMRRVWFSSAGRPAAPVQWLEAEVDQSPQESEQNCRLLRDPAVDGDAVLLSETVLPDRFHVVLFGAGHVGAALVRVLLNLRCTVRWVDQRDAQFPAIAGANLTLDPNDIPEAAVDEAPPGSYFLVMTHSHALDQVLCEHIFRRGDYAFLGLIGSASKRHQFEHRLLAKGFSPDDLERMVCPIGVAGIHDKAPETIAISVAAQLLQRVEDRAHAVQNVEANLVPAG
jgi:xanthine dehydrogenase accessory factor